jgi:transposase
VDTNPLSREEEFTMPKSHKPYAPELKQRLVEMVHAGRNPDELAGKFEPTAQSIRNWVAQAERDVGRRADGLTTEERDELRRLRRENKTLREEREILKNHPIARSHLWAEKLPVLQAA